MSEALAHKRSPARPLIEFAQIPTETMAEIQRLREEISERAPSPAEANGPAISPVDRPPGAMTDIGASVNTVRQIQMPETRDLDIHR